MKRSNDKKFLDKMSNNEAYWKGPFYFNSKDPRIMIPKKQPAMGWTFNLASPYTYIFLVALIVILVVSSLVLK